MQDWVKSYKNKAAVIKWVMFLIFVATLIGLIVSAVNLGNDKNVVHEPWGDYSYTKPVHIAFTVIFAILLIFSLTFLISSLIGCGIKVKEVKKHTIVVYCAVTRNYLIVDNKQYDSCGMYFFSGHMSAILDDGARIEVKTYSSVGSIRIDYLEAPEAPDMFS